MKRIFILCASLLIAVHCFSQTGEIKPITAKQLQTPNNVTFYFNVGDTTFWASMGQYGQMSFASKKFLERYYVPYDGANRDVNLGTKNITSTQQNLPINIGVRIMPDHVKNGDGTITLGSNGLFGFAKTADGSTGVITLPVASTTTITLTDGVVNFVYADYGSGTPTYQVTLDNGIFKSDFSKVPVIRATREGNTVHFEEYDLYGLLLANKLMAKDIYLRGGERLSGLILSTAPTRISTVSAGNTVFAVQYYDNMAANIAGSAGLLYEYYLVSGIWNKVLVTSYDASYYSDGTNRQPLNNNKWVAKYMWRDVGDDNEVYYVHGNQYNSQSEAVNELVPMAPTVMTSHSIYVGKIVIQKGALNGIALPRIWEGAVQTTGASNHYDLSGSSLVWNASGHTGESNTLAAFDSGGLATNTTTGNLTENITGLEFSSTRQVIGGATTLTVSTGYVIPTTDNISHAEIAYTHSQNDADLIIGNEYNTSMSFNSSTKKLELIDGGGTKSTTIDINVGNVVNTYLGKLDVNTSTITVTWPQNFNSTNYFLSINPYYNETINGKTVRISNAAYDFSKTVSGFSLKLDTIAGYLEYFAADTTNLYPLTFSNYISTSSITAIVSNPGSDSSIPSEKAVRTVVEANKMVYPAVGIPVSTGSTWTSSITDNHINWDKYNQWDGGSSGLNAVTGRASLGGSTIGQNMFISTNPSSVSFGQANADNTFSWLNASNFRIAIGSTTIGGNLFTLTNPSAVTFPRFNADNTVSPLSASEFKSAIGAGSVTQITAGLGLSGGIITNTGTLSVNYGTTSITAAVGNDSRLSDTRVPTNTSVSYAKVATDLASSGTVTSTIDLSARSIGYITLSASTAFTFTNYQLGKTYLLIVTANGYTPSFATTARHVFVTGNETLGTSGVFYISLTCIDATSGSEKLLTTIMKGV